MSRVASRPRTAALTAIVALAAGAIAASVLVPVMATAAPVALSGHVLKPSGSVAAGLKVTAVRVSDEVAVSTATTSTSGAFVFPSLPADDYTLKFPKTSTSFAQYLGGESDIDEAQVLELTDGGGNKSYVKFALSPSGTLAGAVKKPNGVALAGYAVRVYDDATLVASATTTTSGKYSFTGLEPGDYLLQATSTSGTSSTAGSWSGGASTRSGASPVLVQAKLTTNYNFVLGPSAKISGTVTGFYGDPTREPLANVVVTPYRQLENYDLEALPALARTTNATGAFTLTGVPAGTYALRFDPPTSAPFSPSGTPYGFRYYESTNAQNLADPFTVAAGATITGKDIELSADVAIAGTVTDASSPFPALADVLVTVSPSGGVIDRSRPFTTHTDASGHYEVAGLSPGEYEVTVGSLVDSDPDDGITEDTSRTRTSALTLAPSAGALTFDFALENRGTVAVTTPPTIASPAGLEVGDIVSATTGDWSHYAGSTLEFEYQWYRGGMAIEGADDPQYKLAPGDFTNLISVAVTANDRAWGSATAESATVTVAQGGAIYQTGEIQVLGDFNVGKTVSISPGSWTAPNWGPVDPVVQIEWIAGPTEATGTLVGTGPTHTITAGDLAYGDYLFWTVQASRYGFADSVKIGSISNTLNDGAFVATKAPKVTKTTTKFTVTNGTWAPTPELVEVVWRVYEKDGSFATSTGTTLPRTSAQKGRYISVTITPVASHVGATPVVLTAQTGSTFTVTGSTAPVGTPRVDSPLDAPALAWLPAPGTTTYKWQYLSGTTWKAIPGATASQYTPTASYLNKKVRVVVSVAKTGYPKASKTSSTVKIGLGTAPAVTGALPSYESPYVNGATTILPGDWSPTPTSYSYQWKVSSTETGPFTSISGATKASFTPPPSMLGKYLRPELTAKQSGHASATVALPVALVAPGITKPTVAPKVTRTGDLFTASMTTASWSPAVDSVDFEWNYWDGGSGFFATGHTFDASTHPDAPIWLTVKGQKSGWATGESTSLVRKGIMRPGDTNQIFQWGSGYYVDTEFEAFIDNSLHPMQMFITSQKIQWEYEKSPGVWVKIPGATQSTFTPTGATFADKHVRYTVTRTADDFATFVEVSETVLVQTAPAPEFSVLAAYDSTAAVADTVGIEPLDWNMPVTLAYRWELAPSAGGPWTPISGATGATYTVPMSAYGKYLHLVLTATRPGHWPKTHTFNAVQLLDGYLDNVTAPKVTKTGSVLSVSTGTWDAPAAAITGYSWVQHEPGGGTSVIGTDPTLTLGPGQVGKKITVSLTATAPLTQPGTVTVLAQRGAAPYIGDPAQQNAPIVGTEVSYTHDWNVAGVTETFQWYRNGVAIPSATEVGYVVTNADIGKTLTLKMTASKDGYATGTMTFSLGTATTSAHASNLTAPTIVRPGGEGEDARVGETLTATPGTWDTSGITLEYQWWQPTGPIAGATSATYTTTTSDLGSELWVAVRATKPFHTNSAWSESYRVLVRWGITPALVSPTDFETAGISKSGTSTIVLKSKPVVWNVPGSVTTYQWERKHAGDLDFSAIPGATSNSYTLGVGDVAGDQFRLKIDVWAPGHPAGQKISNIETPVP